MKPAEVIDDSVYVYRGDLHAEKAAALNRAQIAGLLLAQHQPQQALALAQQAVAIVPGDLFAETALGDAEAMSGNKQAARTAWQSAIAAAHQLEPDAQVSYIPDLEAKLARL
jgi:predicted negative regulator of RcsB-dependent stress response